MMRGNVVVEEQADFDAWLASQPTFAETRSAAAPNLQAGQQSYAACAACHGQNGEGNQALNAPKIAGLQPWYLERQLNYFKSGVRGGEGDTIGASMAPMALMLDDNGVRNVSAYIASFPDTPATPTIVDANVSNGAKIYDRNCAACHLDDGSGTWYTDAPALAGMSDWYFVNQINSFRNRKLRFMQTLTRNLYFKNLDNNAGVIFRLINDAEEEESKEALLAYFFLLVSGAERTAEQLDTDIENWFAV